MLKAYKYRIYPTGTQKEFLAKNFGCSRLVWNLMLSEKLNAYNNKEKIPQTTPAKYKQQYPFLKEVDSLALAKTQLQLEKAFRDHFKNKSHFGLPKFKKRKDKQSYTTNNQNGTVRVENDYLYVPKLKSGIKIKLHRAFDGVIKSTTISKTPSGKYYVSILTEKTENAELKNNTANLSKACGIDLGLSSFAIVTNDIGSCKIDHPHYLKKAEKRLIRLQKRLSKKQKNSKNKEKARLKLADYHQYVSNARNDFLHKLSKAIIDENQVIVVEDLNTKGMVKNHHLAKSISDSGWSTFVTYLEYKAKWYERKLVKVDRFYPSTKTCSHCGYINNDLTLSGREWTCPVCGTHHDRDINASRNLYLVGSERPDVKPVEIGSVDDRKVIALPKKHPIAEAGSHRFYKRG